jgi:hypothetical protein
MGLGLHPRTQMRGPERSFKFLLNIRVHNALKISDRVREFVNDKCGDYMLCQGLLFKLQTVS